ncbi:MAG: AMP-binding protein [Longimicrobiales bacterium]|nr:AMP-binding protein [Longimicrobiales bacterium]
MTVEHNRSNKAIEQDQAWDQFVRNTSNEIGFDDQWEFFETNFEGRPETDGPPIVWSPDLERDRTNLARFMELAGVDSYQHMHEQSCSDRSGFWKMVVERLSIQFGEESASVLSSRNDPKNPEWFAGATMNIVDSCFSAPAERPAVVTRKEGSTELAVTTYGQLEEQVNRVAKGLKDHGFSVGDRIALYVPMTLECVVAYLGIIRAGCCAVSIADSFSSEELAKRLELAEANGLITVDTQTRGGKTLPMYPKAVDAGAPKTVVIPEDSEPSDSLREGDLTWQQLIDNDGNCEKIIGDPYQPINILFSSGTTGTPKAIPWNHLTPIKAAMDGHLHQDVRPDDVVAWPTNIGWMMGPWLIFASLINKATIALFEGNPGGQEFTDFVEDADVSILGVVPALVKTWKTNGSMKSKRWSSLRVFSSTGEPSNRKDYLWLMSRTDYRAPVIEYLGGTEIGGGHITGTLIQPASPSTFTTMALGIDSAIVTDGGGFANENEAGELFLIPPSIGLSQILLSAEHDDVYYQGCPAGPAGEVLRRHGDRIRRLSQGFYKVEGRMDDTMNLGGIKIGSLELERVLETHPAIGECAAVGIAPPDGGAEQLVIYVVPSPGADVQPAQMKSDLDRELSRSMNPLFRVSEVIVMDQLPRTASNKLMRRKLQESY